MTWSLRAGVAQTQIADVALDNARARRGLNIGRDTLVPRAGSLSATLVAPRAAINDEITLQTGAGNNVWSGQIYKLNQTVDRGLNAIRYQLDASGIIARIVALVGGISTTAYPDISVDAAIGHLLDAAGVTAAERDIGSSARMLSLWSFEEGQAVWPELLRLTRTAGPRARIYEDAQGRIVFRDEPLPATPAYVARGRYGSVSSGALVSRLLDVDPGFDRIVNSITLKAREAVTASWSGSLQVTLAPGASASRVVTLNRTTTGLLGLMRVGFSVRPSLTPPQFSGVFIFNAHTSVSGTRATVSMTNFASSTTITLTITHISYSGFSPFTVEREDEVSIATYERRPYTRSLHPYLTPTQAEALAEAIVEYSANPRGSWAIQLDADRDVATAGVALNADIGQRVTVDIDSQFNHDGELVGINHDISGPAGLLVTNLQMLAAEAAAPIRNPLFLDSPANPIVLDDAANPLVLR